VLAERLTTRRPAGDCESRSSAFEFCSTELTASTHGGGSPSEGKGMNSPSNGAASGLISCCPFLKASSKLATLSGLRRWIVNPILSSATSTPAKFNRLVRIVASLRSIRELSEDNVARELTADCAHLCPKPCWSARFVLSVP